MNKMMFFKSAGLISMVLASGLIGGCGNMEAPSNVQYKSVKGPAAITETTDQFVSGSEAKQGNSQRMMCQYPDLSVPGTVMVIAGDWGTMPLHTSAVHRPWPILHVNYMSGNVMHNPVYLHDPDRRERFRDRNPTCWEAALGLLDGPWFYVNLVMAPALMTVHPPLQQVQSSAPVAQSVYNGYLPKGGTIAPAPLVGQIEWKYPMAPKLESVKPE